MRVCARSRGLSGLGEKSQLPEGTGTGTGTIQRESFMLSHFSVPQAPDL